MEYKKSGLVDSPIRLYCDNIVQMEIYSVSQFIGNNVVQSYINIAHHKHIQLIKNKKEKKKNSFSFPFFSFADLFSLIIKPKQFSLLTFSVKVINWSFLHFSQ